MDKKVLELKQKRNALIFSLCLADLPNFKWRLAVDKENHYAFVGCWDAKPKSISAFYLISWNICVSPTRCLHIFTYISNFPMYLSWTIWHGHPDMWILRGVDNSPISPNTFPAAEVVLGAAGDLAKKKCLGASLERGMVGHIILQIFINIPNLHTIDTCIQWVYSGIYGILDCNLDWTCNDRDHNPFGLIWLIRTFRYPPEV